MDCALFTDGLGTTANLLQIAGALGVPTLAAIIGWLLRDRRIRRQTQENLIGAIDGLAGQLSSAQNELELVRRRDPHQWLETFHGTEAADEAIEALRKGIALTGRELHEVFLTIAKYESSLYPTYGQDHLFETRRMTQAAVALDPLDSEAQSLLEEIDTVIALADLRSGTFDPESRSVELPLLDSAYQSDMTVCVVEMLILAIETAQQGDIPSYALCARYARRLAMTSLPANDELILSARQLWSEALALNGMLEASRAEIDQILPVMRLVMSTNDQRLCEMLLWDGLVRTCLGDVEGLRSYLEEGRRQGYLPGPAEADLSHIGAVPEELRQSCLRVIYNLGIELAKKKLDHLNPPARPSYLA